VLSRSESLLTRSARCGAHDAGAGRPGLTWADTFVVAGLVLAGVVVPAGLAGWSGSFAIARNDDWAYERVLFDFVRTGHFSLVGWGAMTLVGQILWAAPFVIVLGAHLWVPGVAVAVAAAIGLGATYLVARAVVGRARGAACALLLLAFPGFVLNTSSFMTDVPAFAAAMVCLGTGAVALVRTGARQWAWLAVSLAVGAFGFSVREFDIAAPVAVLVVLAVRDRRNLGSCTVGAVWLVAACGAIYLWSTGLPAVQHETFGLPTARSVEVICGAYFTLAFFVSPLLAGTARRSWAVSPARASMAATLAVGVGGLLLAGHQALLIGNYVDQRGATGTEVLFGARPELFPGPVWLAVELMALGAGGLLAAVLASSGFAPRRGNVRLGSRRAPLAHAIPVGQWEMTAGTRDLVRLFTWLNVAGMTAFGLLVRAPFFDRYLWPVAFGAAVLLAGRGTTRFASLARAGVDRRWQPGAAEPAGAGGAAVVAPAPASARASAAVPSPGPGLTRGPGLGLALGLILGLVLALVTAAVTLNADAYDAARWSAGEDAVKAGFAPATVDAGFEWVGSHATTVAEPGRRVVGAPAYETWYDQMFPGFMECAFASGSVLDQRPLVLLRTVGYDELVFFLPEHLYLYAVRTRACDSGRLAARR